MKVKLYLRVAVLTAMLFTLVATFKTQPAAACSPGWYDGCMSTCSNKYLDCMVILRAPWITCENSRDSCENNCATKLAACYNQ